MNQQSRIVVLDGTVASKIAAGEVIERPASVIKELVENAIDAGAQTITVDVEEGGQRLLRVTDDGCGMTAQEAILALQRHATSKIRSADDLFSVRTLGFRGEALPSIASVSHFELVSQASGEDIGTRVLVRGGEVTAVDEVGAPVGTRVSVSGLFYNTPARLKFLRSQTTEFAHIAELINRFSFSHRHISFLLTHNSREVLRRPTSPDLREPLARVLGRENATQMIEVAFDSPLMTVTGFISPVEQTRATRSQQYIFVNRRFVRSRMVIKALEDTYHTLLPLHRYPVAVLLIDLDPNLVDVNVHPTKAEVRFSRESEVFVALKRALQEAMHAAGLDTTPTAAGPGFSTPLVAAPDHARILTMPQGLDIPADPVPPQPTPELHPALRPTPTGVRPRFRPLAQLRSLYILAEGDSGLLVVDQHRAHERVLYEQFMREAEEKNAHTQSLLTPVTVSLGARESAILQENMEEMTAFGFAIEEFGADTFLLRAVPTAFMKKDPARLLMEIVEDLATAPSGAIASRREKALITMSCKAAVKAGDPLTMEEMERLLADLSASTRPYTCPHGRPTVMTISNFELDRKFHR